MNHSIPFFYRGKNAHYSHRSVSYKRSKHSIPEASRRFWVRRNANGQTAFLTTFVHFLGVHVLWLTRSGPLDHWPDSLFGRKPRTTAEAYITNVKRPRTLFIFTMYIGCWSIFSGNQGEWSRRTLFPEHPRYLSFATKIPGVHRGSICNIFFIFIFISLYHIHPLASTVASGYCMFIGW
jgi:hypothetical protein